jgi:hypothetical protein
MGVGCPTVGGLRSCKGRGPCVDERCPSGSRSGRRNCGHRLDTHSHRAATEPLPRRDQAAKRAFKCGACGKSAGRGAAVAVPALRRAPRAGRAYPFGHSTFPEAWADHGNLRMPEMPSTGVAATCMPRLQGGPWGGRCPHRQRLRPFRGVPQASRARPGLQPLPGLTGP